MEGRPHRETQCAQRCCDGGLVKYDAYKLHASAAFVAFVAFVALEHMNFESAFEKLCSGDAFRLRDFCFCLKNLPLVEMSRFDIGILP